MISGLKPTELLFRDGTSRADRLNSALDPAFIPVDERTTADLVRFAQQFARRLKFFNNDNVSDGNWEGFLIDDLETYRKLVLDPDKQKERREQWIDGLIAYIADPEAADPTIRQRYGKPHLALFVTFLQLLGVIREQMNGFSERHLDFYYHDVLGLQTKKPIPDLAYVLIDLAEEVNSFVLKKGTAFNAGKDASGKQMVYRATQDTFVNKAKVAELKNVFVDRMTIIGIREAWKASQRDPDGGLKQVMRMAFGYPNPGDPMPPVPNRDNASLPAPEEFAAFRLLDTKKPDGELISEEKNTQFPRRYNYIRNVLCLTIADYVFITSLESASAPEEWEKACVILEKAYKDCLRNKRQQELVSIFDLRLSKKNKEEDFLNLWSYVLGDVNYGNIPPYGQEPFGMKVLNLLNKQFRDANKSYAEARIYALNTLRMSREQFLQVMDLYASAKSSTADQIESSMKPFYAVFEEAHTLSRSFVYTSPKKEVYYGISAFKEARDHLYCLPGEENSGMRFRTFGRASGNIADSAFIGFALSSPQLDLAEGKRSIVLEVEFAQPYSRFTAEELEKLAPQLHFYVSAGEKWQNPQPVSSTNLPVFGIVNNNLGMRLELRFSEQDPPLSAPTQESELLHGQIPHTVLAVLVDTLSDGNELAYKRFRDLQVNRIGVTINVDKLTAIVLQNDDSEIDPRKPFEPFGFRPKSGSAFYIAHPEASSKKLDTIRLNMEWMNAPSDFAAYYESLYKVFAPDPDTANTLYTNKTFTGKLSIREEGRTYTVNPSLPLFNESDAATTRSIGESLAAVPSSYRHLQNVEGRNSVLDWKRYFVLELNNPDFQQDQYPTALALQANYSYVLNSPLPEPTDINGRAVSAAMKEVMRKRMGTINAPYLPKVKSIGLGYTCTFSISTTSENEQDVGLYYIHPFGGETLRIRGTETDPALFSLLPEYSNEGELYIGLDQLETQTQLSLFLKMAEGSADPDTAVPHVSWNYLSDTGWKPFPDGNFISDFTGGLQHSGIITLSLPTDASDTNPLMPGKRYWIRAAVEKNSPAIADTVDIHAQAITVVFEDRENDPQHYDMPLAPETIIGTLEKLPQIVDVVQPYSSYRGRSAESAIDFRNRVSERLRHKNRAVTMWDYEALILEYFPEIHKVKCMPAGFSGNNARQGGVDVVVIPDIRGKLPFNPYQPKASTSTLLRIREFLEQRMPVFADVDVRNATFMQVKARFAVKFRESGNERFLLNQLNDELRRYLAPWAFEEGADIVIGGKIYASMIVNFIAGRSYVEFVTGVKLFKKLNGEEQFTECLPQPGKESRVEPDQPDIVLVSSPKHEIDLISSDGTLEKDLQGIDYMKVELDFRVG